jgi:predicted unusual protein kinase regulating ubiquinone biosynthesis (AarF/ABC1/UbiB family)
MVARKELPESLGRALKIGRLGMNVAGSYLGYQIQNALLGGKTRETRLKTARQKSAKHVREELQNLRGPVMKLGQLLSMQTHQFPEEVVKELAELQMHAPGMHYSLMRACFKNALGKYPEEVFATFEEMPFAAASLGQVHRATTRSGDSVAVKIQYPAIDKAILNDLRLLKTLMLPGRLSGHVPMPLLAEIERGVMEEIDYLHEAQNIAYFRKHLEPSSDIHVPDVYPSLTTREVLTMSFLRGKHLDQFLLSKPSQAARDRLGERLMRLFYYQIASMRALHADPHLGNYLFDKDASIGLVDFGCVKYFPKASVDLFKRFWLQTEMRESVQLDLMQELYDLNGAKVNVRDHRETIMMTARFYYMVYPRKSGAGAFFDFGTSQFFKELNRWVNRMGKEKLGYPESIFMFRAETGLYNVLHKLKAKVQTWKVICEECGRADR